MAKAKTLFVCQDCGHESLRWLGRCPGCDAWNTLVEEIRVPEPAAGAVAPARRGYGAEGGSGPVLMKDVENQTEGRFESGIGELDRVLGGGFVAGGVILLGGDPGIGKSTLSLQVCGLFSERKKRVLYVTGEESATQIRMRGERLGVSVDEVLVLCETSLERVEAQIQKSAPELIVLDSIQTLATERLTSSAGSVAQLREVTSALTQLAKGLQIPTILIGHVTKEGSIAGPKVLEHMVDTVLYFEGESGMTHRILRVVKNRYGATNEIGVFEMRGNGLVGVPNPSAMFLAERPFGASGSVVVPVVEGTRPLLVEIQALVSPTSYGPPRITAVGVDTNRVLLLLNIIEKRTGLQIAGQDVFVNVAGGARVGEPAADLAVAMALASSFRDRPVGDKTAFFGEVGLTGEVRAVSQGTGRLLEGYKLGFERLVIPKGNLAAVEEYLDGAKGDFSRLKLEPVRTLAEALEVGLSI